MSEMEKWKLRVDEISARTTEIRALPLDQMTQEIESEVDELMDEQAALHRAIDMEEKLLAMQEKTQERVAYKTPVPSSETERDSEKEERELVSVKDKRLFRNLGEQLQAIMKIQTDPMYARSEEGIRYMRKLVKVNEETRAATGIGANLDSDAGFAIQTDFAGMILDTAVTEDPILSRCDNYTAGAESDSVRWIDVDETTVATTVFGGVRAYWAAEAATVTATKPKIREQKLELEKLMGLAYVSGESMKHTTFISQLLSRAFSTSIRRELAGAVIAGTGVGKPLGITAGTGTISQAIETGQTSADPILYKNIVKMWHRLRPELRTNAVWLVHPDIEQELEFLDFPVGTGGIPVFLTAGSLAQDNGVSMLKGRPVLATDLCSTKNSVGDIILADLSQYMLLTKGGTEMATSIHVRFLYDEEVFRFIHYGNGMPKRPSALTLKNSSTTRADFVTLAARS